MLFPPAVTLNTSIQYGVGPTLVLAVAVTVDSVPGDVNWLLALIEMLSHVHDTVPDVAAIEGGGFVVL
jgi:hypothetical protein